MEGVCPVNRDVTFLIVLIKFITIMTSSCIGGDKKRKLFSIYGYSIERR